MLKTEGARVLAAFTAGVLFGEAIAGWWLGVAFTALAYLLGMGTVLLGLGLLGAATLDVTDSNPTPEDERWLD